MAALIDIRTVADRLSVHRDTVRKGWKSWVRTKTFPAPVETSPYRWNDVSIAAYLARREAMNRDAVLSDRGDEPANDSRPAKARGGREAEQRDAVYRLMHGAV